jgi:diguanylate cyclase (GGDEF)-like protein
VTTLIGGRPVGASRRWGLNVLIALPAAAYLVAALAPGPLPRPSLAVLAVLFAAAHAVPALVCFARGRIDGPEAWWALGGALICRGLAAVCAAGLLAGTGGRGRIGQAVTDGLVATAALLCILGVVSLVQPGGPRSRSGLEAVLALSAVAAVSLGLAPQARSLAGALHAGPQIASASAVELAWPLADLALLIVVGCGVTATRRAGRDLQLVCLAVLLHATAGIAALRLPQDGAPHGLSGGLLVLAALGYVAAAKANSEAPDAEGPAAPGVGAGRGSGHWVSWVVLAVPSGCAALCAAVLAVGQAGGVPTAARLLAAAGLGLAMVSFLATFREIQRLADGHLQARTDDLTGLANRRSLYEHCDALLPQVSGRRPMSLVLLDLDRFKEVNDALGHAAGDILLSQVGRRIGRTLRPGDLAARLGGDEFAVLLPQTPPAEATLIAERIQHVLSRPFTVGAVTLHAEASLGIATCPPTPSSRSELLRCADVAMYEAKRTRSSIATYASEHDDPDRLRTVEELRAALQGGDPARVGVIDVHFQPQVALSTGEACGVEALIRWQHPARGTLFPGAFLPLAQAAGLMDAVTEVVCQRSASACAEWWRAGIQLPVSVNLPSSAIHDVGLVDRIRDLLDEHGLPAHALTLEITEDLLMNDPPLARKVLTSVRALGVEIAVDDYGTGYSSLAYLRHLPVDELKLDRVFLQEVLHDEGAALLVRHVTDLAHSLGLRLVAEGVDHLDVALMLARIGCDVGQGYLFARAMPLHQLIAWVGTESPVGAALAGAGRDAAVSAEG